eukprot:TRINITY_DN38268_c0_g1_i1.p1 TRINITY_DN38268_c0_g1~~TRINITY_DN38268_c0_g1_i1.p1  ORF type:complete len:625 (-),score=86.04 TRINITY_DN38268_c0_g1_i1:55-1929(-)
MVEAAPGTFECCLCKRWEDLNSGLPLGRCSCLMCRTCLKREVETCLKQHFEVSTPCSKPSLRSLPCPSCGIADGLERSDIVDLCSAALRSAEEAAAEARLLTFPRCPACGTAVELLHQAQQDDDDLPEGLRRTGIPEFDRTVPRHLAQWDSEGRPLNRDALVHRHRHRFRCTCSADFCSACKATPYHLGYDCAAWALLQARPDCLFCEAKATSLDVFLAAVNAKEDAGVPHDDAEKAGAAAKLLAKTISQLPLKTLREELTSLGVSAVSYCVERREVEMLARYSRVCSAAACRARLSASCFRPLTCGHLCAGCNGEERCSPCLACNCSHVSRSASSCATAVAEMSTATWPSPWGQCGGSCPICAEAIPPGPALSLDCGHALHVDCLRKLLAAADADRKAPLSFEHWRCPACRVRIGDVRWPQDISAAFQKASALEADVASRALKRLKRDPRHRRDDAILPGGAFEGRLRDYAFTLYSYHLCEECKQPYFGGERRCDVDAAAPAPQSPRSPRRVNGVGGEGGGDRNRANSRRLCGGCGARKAGKVCPAGHDASFVEWKCRFCCSLAVWFCWGTTHMCDRCHFDIYRTTRPCLGASQCPLGGKHPPNGSGEPVCLGCSLCRHSDGF